MSNFNIDSSNTLLRRRFFGELAASGQDQFKKLPPV